MSAIGRRYTTGRMKEHVGIMSICKLEWRLTEINVARLALCLPNHEIKK